jgi:hypothetical protein
MRLFCELFLVAVLIWLGWTKSFHDRMNQIRGVEPSPQQSQVSQTAAAASSPAAPRQPFLPRYAPGRPLSTPSGDWMWDPAHRNTLDKPAYKTGSTPSPAGQGYWIDGRGVRHFGNSPSVAPSPQ